MRRLILDQQSRAGGRLSSRKPSPPFFSLIGAPRRTRQAMVPLWVWNESLDRGAMAYDFDLFTIGFGLAG